MIQTLTIDQLGHRGDGVSLSQGGATYVPFALPGETVEAEPVQGHPDRRKLLRVESPSPDRVTPFCPHFGVCGGCAIQHLRDEPYRTWKRNLVIETLAQAGIDVPVDPLIDAHGAGRRRITLHARRGTHDILKVGFSAAASHDVIGIDHCPILDPGLNGALEAAWALAEALTPVGKPLDIQVTATENGLDIDVRGSGPLPPKMITALSQLAEQHKLARLTRHGELVLLRRPPVVAIGKAKVTLPPGAFLQATALGEQTLAGLAMAHLGRAKQVADLFCGVGPFALRLAEKARVFACDSDAPAVTALQKAAPATPGLKPVKAEARDLFRRPLAPPELRDFDAVLFDPPRQGAQAQAAQLAASRVPLVIAVSCNATTFARDAKLLIDGGYKIEGVIAVDQFKYTPHVELVASFRKK
ncbi:class I SAM-dependent RNA methyltransferase [Rhodopseudomonas palustris]|uniref:class I SAM-dependent RNA methyltransferase n=1 Tax=Rhodopseudomonas palustris TaxID=1076 RepID=UPI000641BFA6|nr:methyltransferase [Rhodopseudomonas palustris]